MARTKTKLEKQIPVEVVWEIERVERRIERLKRFMELGGPEVIIQHECRMASYGMLLIATAYDNAVQQENAARLKTEGKAPPTA